MNTHQFQSKPFFILNFISLLLLFSWHWLVFMIVLVFSMPRLMAGVHWFSDVMVGGISIATTTLAFGLYMPLLNYVNKTLENIASKFLTK